MSYKHCEDGMGWGGLVPTAQERAEEKLHAQIKKLLTQLAEAKEQLAKVCAAGQEVVNRWDSPAWKWDDENTGHKVNRLRDAINATRAQPNKESE